MYTAIIVEMESIIGEYKVYTFLLHALEANTIGNTDIEKDVQAKE